MAHAILSDAVPWFDELTTLQAAADFLERNGRTYIEAGLKAGVFCFVAGDVERAYRLVDSDFSRFTAHQQSWLFHHGLSPRGPEWAPPMRNAKDLPLLWPWFSM